MTDWLECDCCGKEYKIICDAGDEKDAIHCPFCGSEGDFGWPEEDPEDEE